MAVRAGINIWTAPAIALQNPELDNSFSRVEGVLPGLVSSVAGQAVSEGVLPGFLPRQTGGFSRGEITSLQAGRGTVAVGTFSSLQIVKGSGSAGQISSLKGSANKNGASIELPSLKAYKANASTGMISSLRAVKGNVSAGTISSLQANKGSVSDTTLPSFHSIVLNEGRTVGVLLPSLSSFVPDQINVEDAALPSFDGFAGDTNAASSDTVFPSLLGAASVEPTPSFSFSSQSLPSLKSGFTIGSVPVPEGVEEASLPSLLGFGGDIVGAVSNAAISSLTGSARNDPARILVAMPAMGGGLSRTELRVDEQLQLADTTAGTLAIVINEILAIQANAATSLFGKIEVTEQTVALALAAIPYNLDIVEALQLQDDPDAVALKLVQAVEALATVDDFDSQAILLLSTVLALAIGDKAQTAYLLSFEELLEAVDVNKANLVTAAKVVEELLCTPLVGDNGIFVVASAETLAALDISGTAAQLRIAVEEGLAAYVRFKVGEDTYQGWVMNAKEAGFTQYDNFPFNSFAKLRGEVYAASDTGIYKLGGDTDAGDVIDARLKTGLLDLGSHKMKNVKAAYLGFTGDDRMILKVTVVDRGQKNEHWYEAIPSDAGAFRDGRVTIQQGLRSRYWQFELANIDGADFDIDDIDFTYNVLSRGYR